MAGYPYYTPAPVGNGSMVVNGQILPVPMSGQFFPPLASAPFYKGQGQPPPTVPLNYMQGSSGMNDASAKAAADNPFSFVQSPLVIAVGALVIGLLGLRYIHWRK
jgi:hypothetical protein